MKRGHIRHGSLQFYPRKRAEKIIPRVNWHFLSQTRPHFSLLGFIGYKVGMKSAYVKDDSPTSITKGKRIILPVTIIECPPMKILSVRAYKDDNIISEWVNESLEKELKEKIKMPKQRKKNLDAVFKDVETTNSDVRIIVYSQVKKTGIKKKPDITEIGLSGSVTDKINFIKNNIVKEITLKDFLSAEFKEKIVDVRGVTKGKGFTGSTKRFGLDLLPHKTEKGIRGPGSGGAWHPARVEFRQPMAGQMGFFTRITYNNKIIFSGDILTKNINPRGGFHNFGTVKNDYLIVTGSVQGPEKRGMLLTVPLRPTKKQLRKNYSFVELR